MTLTEHGDPNNINNKRSNVLVIGLQISLIIDTLRSRKLRSIFEGICEINVEPFDHLSLAHCVFINYDFSFP